MKNRDLIQFVEKYTDGKVTVHSAEAGFVVFKMNSVFSLEKLMAAVENEFDVEFDFPVDPSFIIMEWKQ